MNLRKYPGEIAQAAQAMNELDAKILAAQQHLERLENQADANAAFDAGLKNDNQRRAKRFELLCVDSEYQTVHQTLQQLQLERSRVGVQLNYLRDSFSVAKLEAKLAIAHNLAIADLDTRELVGI